MSVPEVEVSKHVRDMLRERVLHEEWTWRVVRKPDRISVEPDGTIHLDFDASGRVAGVEILQLSSRVAPEQLRTWQFGTA